jgi:hypothetical protein
MELRLADAFARGRGLPSSQTEIANPMRSLSRIISCCSSLCLAFALAPLALLAQAPATAKNPPSQAPPAAAQNPSPMVEHTRTHPRLTKISPPGDRYTLPLGTLFVPQGLRPNRPATLLFFFHGGDWLPELAASRQRQMAVVLIQAGAGSGSYVQLFKDPTRFLSLVAAAESASHMHFSQIALGGWSAGCGAIRQILLDPASYDRVHRVLCIDGVHTGYTNGTPGPGESDLDASNLQIWLRFGRDAIAGKKRLIITHSEIFPGTFSSTTETADWLLRKWQLTPHAVVRFGPMGTQMLSRVSSGGLTVIGFAGNSAPDHVDELHSLPEYLHWLEQNK